MAHVRKQIRDAVVSAVTGLTTTASRVYPGQALPVEGAQKPCLLVYARREESEYDSPGALRNTPVRRLEVHVEGRASATTAPAVEALLDLIAEEVETALFSAAMPGVGFWMGPQELAIEASGEAYDGTVDMSFTAMYRTAEGAPGTSV